MDRSMLWRCTGAALLLALGGTAGAQTVTNGGFEGGPAANGNAPVQVGQTTIPGWTVVNASGTTVGGGKEVAWLGNGAYGFNTPFGTDFLDLTGYGGSTGNSGVAQTIATTVGNTYTLSFYLGNMTGAAPTSAIVSAGGQTATLVDPVTTGTLAGTTLWTLQTFSFVATAASTTLSIIGGTTTNDFIGLDNVSIGTTATAPVPEPASWALMVAGFGMAGTAMRRRRRQSAEPVRA